MGFGHTKDSFKGKDVTAVPQSTTLKKILKALYRCLICFKYIRMVYEAINSCMSVTKGREVG